MAKGSYFWPMTVYPGKKGQRVINLYLCQQLRHGWPLDVVSVAWGNEVLVVDLLSALGSEVGPLSIGLLCPNGIGILGIWSPDQPLIFSPMIMSRRSWVISLMSCWEGDHFYQGFFFVWPNVWMGFMGQKTSTLYYCHVAWRSMFFTLTFSGFVKGCLKNWKCTLKQFLQSRGCAGCQATHFFETIDHMEVNVGGATVPTNTINNKMVKAPHGWRCRESSLLLGVCFAENHGHHWEQDGTEIELLMRWGGGQKAHSVNSPPAVPEHPSHGIAQVSSECSHKRSVHMFLARRLTAAPCQDVRDNQHHRVGISHPGGLEVITGIWTATTVRELSLAFISTVC